MGRRRNQPNPSKSQREKNRIAKRSAAIKPSIADAIQNIEGLDPTKKAIALLTLNAIEKLSDTASAPPSLQGKSSETASAQPVLQGKNTTAEEELVDVLLNQGPEESRPPATPAFGYAFSSGLEDDTADYGIYDWRTSK